MLRGGHFVGVVNEESLPSDCICLTPSALLARNMNAAVRFHPLNSADSEPYSPDLVARADRGEPRAQFMVGVCYAHGLGVVQDAHQAVIWYRKAAEHGHAGAQFNLGICYMNGTGVDEDEEEARLWIRKAAGQGLPEALRILTGTETSTARSSKIVRGSPAVWRPH